MISWVTLVAAEACLKIKQFKNRSFHTLPCSKLAPLSQEGHRKSIALNVRNFWPALYKDNKKKTHGYIMIYSSAWYPVCNNWNLKDWSDWARGIRPSSQSNMPIKGNVRDDKLLTFEIKAWLCKLLVYEGGVVQSKNSRNFMHTICLTLKFTNFPCRKNSLFYSTNIPVWNKRSGHWPKSKFRKRLDEFHDNPSFSSQYFLTEHNIYVNLPLGVI